MVIDRNNLPLSSGKRLDLEQKRSEAIGMAQDVLDQRRTQDKEYSVGQLRAFQEGLPICRNLSQAVGADHAVVLALMEALRLLTCGYHAFEGNEKAEFYSQARLHGCRAVAGVIVEGLGEEFQVGLESRFLPAIGGLIQRARKRRS